MSEWMYLDGKPFMVCCKNVAPLVNCHFARATYYTKLLIDATFKDCSCRPFTGDMVE